MSECRTQETPSLPAAMAQRVRCDRFFAGFAVMVLVHAGDAAAAEQASVAGGTDRLGSSSLPLSRSLASSSIAPSAFSLPEGYTLRHETDAASLFAGPMRARGATAANPEAAAATDQSLMQDNPVWQRLADFRALGRLRVLTLWQTGANSLSLQAGRKGTPSLQWTAKLSDGSPGSSSLFNRMTPAYSGRDIRGVAHPAAAAANPAKPSAVPGPAHSAAVAPP